MSELEPRHSSDRRALDWGEVVHVRVQGRVQGVGFREFTRRIAQMLRAAGWVRNLPTGEVEVLLRIAPQHKAQLLSALRRGPPFARVESVANYASANYASASYASSADCPLHGVQIR